MKKTLVSILSLITVISGALVSVTPASAGILPNGGDVYYSVGDTVSLDLGCQESGTYSVTFASGVLPDGLSMDSEGLVTGVPTTVGDYTISNYNCSFTAGGNGYFYWSLTFHIAPVVTPTPVLAVHSLNKSDCSFYLGFLFTATPDAGSVYIDIDNGSGNSIHAYLDPTDQRSSGVLYGGNISIEDLNQASDIFGLLLSINGYRAYSCGDTLNVTLGYQTRGAPVGTASVTGVVVDKPADLPGPTPGSAPIQKLTNLNNNNCEFRVLAWLPTTPLAGSTKITINSYHPEGTVDFLSYTIADVVANGVMDFTFNPTDLSSGPSIPDGVASQEYQVSTSWACGATLYVNVEYRDLLNNYWMSASAPELQTDGFSVTPTRPETTNNYNGEYSITAAQSNVGACNISVVATLPDEARPVGIAITSVDNTDWISAIIVYEPYSVNGVITANLSFTSTDAIFANVPVDDEDKILEGTPECSGTYRAIIDSPGGLLASTTFTLGQTMPTCNAGSILDEEEYRCLEVERGFYTTELNSSTPIACPSGMTTANKASKSVNDCYKPLVQSIVGLKAPKALKFKGTTNLAITTNTKTLAGFKVVGPCSAKLANVVTTVKGKKVTTKMLKVTAGSKAGNCLINLTSPTSGKYLDLVKQVQIKVSKTGK